LIRIGTSGWTYPHWKGDFYPEKVPQKRWLEYYAQHFDTVELNASFYHIPRAATTRGWAERTPPEFRFAVKVSRLITHVHKLAGCEETVAWFFREFEPLAPKTAAYLFQLPPAFAPRPERLESFLRLLPPGNRYAFELRHPESYAGAVPEILARHGVAFCIHDLAGLETPDLVTASLVYLRFHGPGGRYAGSYTAAELARRAARIRDWAGQGRDVLATFNNDIGGQAIRNAATLADLIGR
jgi:uncharacterized protein YecE (DUF72 family)